MPTDHPDLALPLLNRRAALLGAVGLLALPTPQLAAAATPPAPDVWPNPAQVPGGVARLSLGPAAVRPVAQAGEMPLLVPGVGAQGGDVEATVRSGKTSSGAGMMINSSRAILYAPVQGDEDFAAAARRVALETRDAINLYR